MSRHNIIALTHEIQGAAGLEGVVSENAGPRPAGPGAESATWPRGMSCFHRLKLLPGRIASQCKAYIGITFASSQWRPAAYQERAVTYGTPACSLAGVPRVVGFSSGCGTRESAQADRCVAWYRMYQNCAASIDECKEADLRVCGLYR